MDDYEAANRFLSGIVRSVCCPMGECWIWSMKSPFLTGKKAFTAFSLSQDFCFILWSVRMPGSCRKTFDSIGRVSGRCSIPSRPYRRRGKARVIIAPKTFRDGISHRANRKTNRDPRRRSCHEMEHVRRTLHCAECHAVRLRRWLLLRWNMAVPADEKTAHWRNSQRRRMGAGCVPGAPQRFAISFTFI
jgi:hypothetical protein